MDILDRIKQFINESIQSLFVQQKEDFSIIIHKEIDTAVSDIKIFTSQLLQANERDMANMQQTVFSLNQGIENLLRRLDAIQESIDLLKERHSDLPVSENAVQPEPHNPITTICYAKMVDSINPIGFKIENLKSSEDGCAFKITLTDDLEGTYEIVDDREIQQEMLAAFNPLISDSSVFDFVPQNPTGVTVVQPGTVVKDNQVLRIENKQKLKIS
mgnify:FL=1